VRDWQELPAGTAWLRATGEEGQRLEKKRTTIKNRTHCDASS